MAYGETYEKSAKWHNILDKTTRGEIHLSVDYRSKGPVEITLVVWKDDEDTLHISNLQGQLSQKITGDSEMFQHLRAGYGPTLNSLSIRQKGLVFYA